MQQKLSLFAILLPAFIR